MRVLIATDAWRPQVNGVVTTLTRLQRELSRLDVDVTFVTPDEFPTLPLPGYRDIRLALARSRRVKCFVDMVQPDWIHIATEGPIGWAMRRFCLSRGRRFTTSYHTKFPEYASKIAGLPVRWVYAFERRFHAPSAGVMCATASLESDLKGRGFHRLMRWTRGVDINHFRPRATRLFGNDHVFLYVGRVSREKNIEAFLTCDLPGRKVVVGDGPHLAALARAHPDVLFTGRKTGDDLAAHYASGDVFVFPSRTDTFGLVLLEAMASGLPVAAYPVTGPIDIVENGVSGILSDDLAGAARLALTLERDAVRARAAQFTWAHSAEQFLNNIHAAQRRADDVLGINAGAQRASVTRRSSLPSIMPGQGT